MLQAKTLYHNEKQGLATRGFQKIPDTPPKPAEAEPSFRKVSLPPAFSPLTSGLESFDHKSTPFDRPWIEAYCPTF